MKRFLFVLALVAVAGATYIAAAPGSQTAGPTAAQFRALKMEVGDLKMQLQKVKKQLHHCMAGAFPITLRGDWQSETPTFGYSYSDPNISANPFPQTAFDLARPGDTGVKWLTGGGAKCAADVGTARRNAAALFGGR